MSLTQQEKFDRLEKELQHSVQSLKNIPEVSAVILGPVHLCRHQKKPGELKVVGRTKPNMVLMRGWFDGGTRELFVYSPDEQSTSNLLERLRKIDAIISQHEEPPKPKPSIAGPLKASVRDVIRQAKRDRAQEDRAARQLVEAAARKPAPPELPQPKGLAALKVEGSPESAWIEVTPELATSWLEKFNSHNREAKETAVARYVADIRAGRWSEFTHQGVAFHKDPFVDDDAILLDGQNRLWAIAIAEKSVIMQVNVGVPIEAQKTMDDHVKRSMVDVYGLDHGRSVRKAHTGAANAMVKEAIRWTRQELYEFMERHWKAIDFAVSEVFRNNSRRGITIGPVYAAIARASYHVDREKLIQFGQILLNGMVTDETQISALILRNWLMNQTTSRGSTPHREVVYKKTQRALMAFADQEKISKLYEAQDELFPLPEEQAIQARAAAS